MAKFSLQNLFAAMKPYPRHDAFDITNPLSWRIAFWIKPDGMVRRVEPEKGRFTAEEIKRRFLGDCQLGAVELYSTNQYIMLVNGPLQSGQNIPGMPVNGDASYVYDPEGKGRSVIIGDALVCHRTVLPEK